MTNSDQTSQQPTPDNQEEKKIIRGKLPFICYGKATLVEIVTDDEDVATEIGAMFGDALIVEFLRNGGIFNDELAESASLILGREFTQVEKGYIARLVFNAKFGKTAEPFVHTLREMCDGKRPKLDLQLFMK